ncbi:MAG: DinB family protein [Chloroflexota bacterium]|nr:DinB family protein [Chloroflexota bacterium]
MVSDRVQMLAARVAEITDEVIAFAEQCTLEEWRSVTYDERWQVGVVCRHIARSLAVYPAIIRRQVSGEPPPAQLNWEDVHCSNAQQAKDWADGSEEEAVAMLRRHGDQLARTIRLLADEQLGPTATSPLTGKVLSTQQVVASMIGHVRGHLQSAEATVSKH